MRIDLYLIFVLGFRLAYLIIRFYESMDLLMSECHAVAVKLSVEYKSAGRRRKSELIDQLHELTGWNPRLCSYNAASVWVYAGVSAETDCAGEENHAHARGVQGRAISSVAPGRGRKRVYTPSVVRALEKCWRIMNTPHGKRLAPFLVEVVPMLIRDGDLCLTVAEQELLMQMSASSIDRHLTGAAGAITSAWPLAYQTRNIIEITGPRQDVG